MWTAANAQYRLDKEKDDRLIGRLANWKFGQALQHLRDDHPDEVKELVVALANTFGSTGWFDGHMATIISEALANVLPLDDTSDI